MAIQRSVFLLGIATVVVGCLASVWTATDYKLSLVTLSVLSIVGFLASIALIPIVGSKCLAANLTGKDKNKNSETPIPEGMGLVTASIYVIVVILFQPLFSFLLPTQLIEYNAALISICMMIMLGFTDDVLDLRWSVKIFLSFLATLPLLVAYSGPTTIIVPKPLRMMFGLSVNLGVFCTNSINIYAGVNGLEVGQALVIACSVLIHETLQLVWVPETPPNFPLLSIFLLVPFIAMCSALFYYNWYPSKVFVGDTFTYSAGMSLAVVGILCHSSKTLMLFFIPQLINFAISLPQLFRFIPCPRHRLPRYSLIHSNEITPQPYWLTTLKSRRQFILYDPKTGKLFAVTTNWNLLNFSLWLLGPKTEHEIVSILMKFQILCSCLAFAIRYYFSTWFY